MRLQRESRLLVVINVSVSVNVNVNVNRTPRGTDELRASEGWVPADPPAYLCQACVPGALTCFEYSSMIPSFPFRVVGYEGSSKNAHDGMARVDPSRAMHILSGFGVSRFGRASFRLILTLRTARRSP